MRDKCAQPKCDRFVYTKHLCASHYDKRRRLLRFQGHYQPTRLDDVREHLALLRRNGWSWVRIGNAAHIDSRLIQAVVRGERETLPRVKVRQILAVTPDPLPSRLSVNAIGARRRLRALACMGWSTVDIADHAGLSTSTLRQIAGGADSVRSSTAQQIDVVYRLLRNRFGGSKRAVMRARERGYVPPTGWIPETIDDPAAAPLRRAA